MNISLKKIFLTAVFLSGLTLNFFVNKTIGAPANQPSEAPEANAGTLARLEITNVPASVQAGQQFPDSIEVTAYDQFGQIEDTYNGTITWHTSDVNENVLLPTDDGSEWNNGSKKFSGALFKLCTAGTQWLSVSDGSITSTTYNVTVEPAALDSFKISGIPLSTEAGSAFNNDIEVTAYDLFGNIKDDYQGTVDWISSDGFPYPADLPEDDGTGWSEGKKTFSRTSFTLYNTIEQTVTVQDGSITNTSDPITVYATDLDRFEMSGVPSSAIAGQQFNSNVTVSAFDEYNNLKTNYSGIVTWNSSDGTPYPASLPTDDGTGWVNGSKTFSGSSFLLFNAPSQTIRVSDGTVSRTSNSILVLPNELGDFTIGGLPETRRAGQPFSYGVTVTAFDSYKNQKTDYEGIIIWSSSDIEPYPATLPVDNGTGWNNGQKVFFGSSFILYNSPQQTITVTDGDISKTSSSITITYAAIDTFALHCGSVQTAGIPFALTATDAQDKYQNNWSGMVTVTCSNLGGNSPNGSSPIFNDIQVINGSGQANQILVKAENGIELKGEVNDISSVVSNILVNPGSLSQLKIKDVPIDEGEEIINDTLSVGESLDLYSVGYDGYGNFRGTESVDWSSQGLTPSVNISGKSNITYIPSKPGNGNISIHKPQTDISAHTGPIIIIPGQVSYFEIGLINTQVTGQPFPLNITAYDENDNVKTNFTGTVDITDSSGTIQPETSSNFVNGIWNGSVTVNTQYSGDVITVSETGAEEPAPKGVSNSFNVINAPGLRILDFKAVKKDYSTLVQHITANQNKDWFLIMTVENLSSNNVTLDSVGLNIKTDGKLKDDYQISIPDTFKNSGTEILSGYSTDTLVVTIDSTGADEGSALIQGFLYTSTIAGEQLTDQAWTSVNVQTPADLIVNEIITSQNEVTVAQDTSWTIAVVLSNRGESSVLIDSVSADVSSSLSFSIGDNWLVIRPDSLAKGGWILEGETIDSLIYQVIHTGENSTGECKINASVSGTEINTELQISDNTDNAGWGTVTIEEEAELKILELRNMAPNAPYVNINQEFDMKITVANTGGDGLHDIGLLLSSEHPWFNFPTNIPVGSIEGGKTSVITVTGNAFQSYLYNEIFKVSGGGWTDNKNDSLASKNPVDDTTKVHVQQPGILSIEKIITSTNTVMGGQTEPWFVKVILTNGQGQAPLDYYAEIKIDTVKSNISFWHEDLKLTDYIIECTTKDISLKSGEKDTLVYKIKLTGLYGGEVEVKSNIQGVEKNSGNIKQDNASTLISVQSNPAFRIVSTVIDAYNTTEGGNAYVDTNQEFKVIVSVENGLGHAVRNINVHLESGASDIENSDLTILSLTPSQRDSVVFYLTASEMENISGETFTASITSAKKDDSDVPVGPALDSIAIAYIQTPADLSIKLDLSNPIGEFTTNQVFTLTAHLENYGSGAIDTTGKVRITLPSPYTLTGSVNNAITLNSPATWEIKSPNIATDWQTINVTMYKPPLSKNTRQVAKIEKKTEKISVITHKSFLTSSLGIASPPGAVNQKVSSDQYFVVRASLTWNYVRDITTSITLPTGYTTSDNLDKKVISNEVTWQIRAPKGATDKRTIYINASGYDALQQEDVIISAEQKGIEIQTVKKADLALNLNIDDKSVSPSQEFILYADIENKGEADTIGTAMITLEQLPEGYTTKESQVHYVEQGKTNWKIKAPPYSTGETANISAYISKIPWDQNTSEEAYVSKVSADIGVTTVGTWLSVTELDQPDSISSQVISGQNDVWVTGFELINRGEAGANGVLLTKIKFNLLNFSHEPLNPSSIYKTIKLCKLIKKNGKYYFDKDSCLATLSPSQIPAENPVTILIDNMNPIKTQDTLRIALLADMHTVEKTVNFMLEMPDSTYITAVDEYVPFVSLPILSPSGDNFEIKSNWQKQVISSEDVGTEDKTYLLNFPNPFGSPDKKSTTIVYYLEKDTDVNFNIYNLIGELVWSESFSSTDPEGRKGLHSRGRGQVEWDGTNDYGHLVLNGVYILVMDTEDNIVKTKIAVVK